MSIKAICCIKFKRPVTTSPQIVQDHFIASCQVSKKYVSKEICTKIHEKAQPFITWLKEAEEESSDEDEDEEHVEVVYATEKEEKMKREGEKSRE